MTLTPGAGDHPSSFVPAAKVRAGDWLLVNGYVREAVRVETVTTPSPPGEPNDPGHPGGPGEADGAIQRRVCFLNGGALTVPATQLIEIARPQPPTEPEGEPEGWQSP